MTSTTRPSAIVLVIIDGLGDISSEHTEATTTLSRAAASARCGLVDPVSPGVACGSDTAHLSIFGYSPKHHYRGRGAFEALGASVPILPGDIAFKCNLACLDHAGVVTARCPARGPNMHALAARLCIFLNDHLRNAIQDIGVSVTHAGAHRCIVRFSGPGLSDAITNTDPLVNHRPLLQCTPTHPHDAAAVRTARLANHVSDVVREALEQCAENVLPGIKAPAISVILLRGAAMGIDLTPFPQRTGLHTFLIAPTKIIAGIGQTAGMDLVDVKGATGGYDTDLMQKAAVCVDKLMCRDADGYAYNLGIVHVKAVDEANKSRQAHERSALKKAHWLAQVDMMVARILRLLIAKQRRDVILCVTGDHTTPSVYGDHTCEPVPILLCDVFDPDAPASVRVNRFIGSDDCESFSSTEMGALGSLGRFSGREIPRLFCSLMFGGAQGAARAESGAEMQRSREGRLERC